MKFRSAIQVPEKISQAIFELPIVAEAQKGYYHKVVYCVNPYVDKDHVVHEAMRISEDVSSCEEAFYIYPTDWVCQTEEGEYYILTDEQYKKIKE